MSHCWVKTNNMKKITRCAIRNKVERKLNDLELLILQSEIRQFGTWLYNKRQEEREKDFP